MRARGRRLEGHTRTVGRDEISHKAGRFSTCHSWHLAAAPAGWLSRWCRPGRVRRRTPPPLMKPRPPPCWKEGSNDARPAISLSAALAKHTPRRATLIEPWKASTVGSHTRAPDALVRLVTTQVWRPPPSLQCDPLDARHLAHGPLTTAALLYFPPFSRTKPHRHPSSLLFGCLGGDQPAACSALLPTSPTAPVR